MALGYPLLRAPLLVAVLLTACGPGSRAPSPPGPSPAHASSSQASASDSSELAAVAKARADSLRRPYLPADVQFMAHMIGHHAQAVVMAGWAPTHGASPAVRRLAERIVNAQEDEIATMQQWLRDRREPVPPARPAAMKMHGNGAEHEMLMPGMLTESQMRQLDQASGPEFDRLFLTFMIQHHRGAVTMVQHLFETPGAARDETVFKLANDVQVDQSTEINRMEAMLASLTREAHTQ